MEGDRATGIAAESPRFITSGGSRARAETPRSIMEGGLEGRRVTKSKGVVKELLL